MQLGSFGKTIAEHDAPLLDGVLEGLLGHVDDDLENVRQAQVAQSGIDAHGNVVEVDGLGRLLGGGRSTGGRIDSTHPRNRQRLVRLRIDHVGDALLLGIPQPGLLIEVLHHLAQRQAVELDLVDADGVQLVIDGLTARPGVDPVGLGEGVGDRQLRFGLFPVLLDLQELVLVGEELLAVGAGVLGLTDDVQVLVGGGVVRIELDGLLQLGLRAVEVAHLEGQLAVLHGDGGRELVGPVGTDMAQSLLGGNAAHQIGKALIVLPLEVLGLHMVGVDLEETLDLKVGLLVVARLGGVVGERQARGGEARDGRGAFLLDARTQFFGQIPCVLVRLGGRDQVALLGGDGCGLQRLAEDDGFFFAPYGDLTGILRGDAHGSGVERGNECDETQDLRDFRHGFLHGLG